MGSAHQEFIVDMFTTFRGILWKYNPSHTETVRGGGGGGAQQSVLPRVHLSLKPFPIVCCMLNSSANLVKSLHSAEKLQGRLVGGKERNMTNSQELYYKCASTHMPRMKQQLYKPLSLLIKGKEKTFKEKDSMVLNNGFFLWPLYIATGCFLCHIKLGPDCHPNMTTFDTLEPSGNTCKRWLVSTMASCHARAQHGIVTLLSSKAHQCQK